MKMFNFFNTEKCNFQVKKNVCTHVDNYYNDNPVNSIADARII